MLGFFTRKRIYLLSVMILLASYSSFSESENNKAFINENNSLYNQLQLARMGLKEEIFNDALKGWKVLCEKQNPEKPNVLSIADLSQSSNSKRLYIIDIVQKKVLFNTYVAHGRNSGEEFAKVFANKSNSYKSSLGFYVTGNTYQGKHGLSMKLKGLEKGINDIAEERGIVMHGASYVSESFIKEYGRLGRSQGCPAVSEKLSAPIINSIKDGSCFFMFYPDSSYYKQSVFL
jgi:hypothetical protein